MILWILIYFSLLGISEQRCEREGSRRIAGGTRADPSIKFHVLIEAQDAKGKKRTCGGVIMETETDFENTILTAASCIYQSHPNYTTVRYGHLEKAKLLYTNPTTMVIHHSFLDGWQKDTDVDIAIIHAPLQLNSFSTINLPKVDPPCEFYVAGFGSENQLILSNGSHLLHEKLDHPKLTDRLLSTEVNILDKNVCKEHSSGLFSKIKDTETCILFYNTGPCSGDEGGPLYYSTDFEKYFLRGIISWSHGCGAGDYPSVVTDLTNEDVLKWYRKYSKMFEGDFDYFNYFAGAPHDPDFLFHGKVIASPRTHILDFPLAVVYDVDEPSPTDAPAG